MPNEGNRGAVQFLKELQRVLDERIPKERILDFGEIRSDYSLITDSFSAVIPRGEWSFIRQPISWDETGSGLAPGDRVVVAWVGNEAVVLGRLMRL